MSRGRPLLCAALLALACGRVAARAGEQAAEPRVLGRLPDFELTDESGRPFGTEELRGKIWLATFIFTHCRSTCPLQTATFGRLQADFARPPLGDAVWLVSITVDPARDTVEALREYAAAAHADPQRWKFLTGAREAIWTLCKRGFMLPVTDEVENANELIAHSQSIVLVDAQGRLRGYYDALDGDDVESLKRDVARLVEASAAARPAAAAPPAGAPAERRTAPAAPSAGRF